jgi:hypothetical protein
MPNLTNLSTQFTSIFRSSNGGESTKFGTFNGVFLPTLLTILGAVMYLRTGWVVGNAGLWGGLLIITLANAIVERCAQRHFRLSGRVGRDASVEDARNPATPAFSKT